MSTSDRVCEKTAVSDDIDRNDKEKKSLRKVSFPNDEQLVTQYFEPSNPWQDVPSTTRAQLAAEYLEACRCHTTHPIDSVLQQIRELPENTIGGSARAPRLALSDCSLLGSAPADALEALLRKVQFRRLEIDHAEIDDEGAEALFDMVEYYESAAVVCLIGPLQFGIRGWQAVARLIKKSAELSELEISESPLEANHSPVLARSLRPATCRLRSVCLQRASLAGESLLCLVIALKTNSSVRELRLGDNGLTASDAAHVASLLRYNTRLQLLDLSNNQIQDAGVGMIAEALVEQAAHSPPSPHQCPMGVYEARGLAFLVLWNNQLTRNCAGHLARILGASQSLCVLNVGRNALGSDAVRSLITDRIGGGPLVSLGLQAARLGPEAARALADLIRNDTKLQRLDLRDNKLGAAGLQAILNAMKENTTLTQIDLDEPAESTTSVGAQSCTESATVARLLRDIRALCRRNEPAAPAPPDRLLRKISLTCHTAPAPKQQCVPADDEERKVRLRSPAPSPAGSPVPAAGSHSRFSVRALRSPVSQQQCVPADDEERKVRLRSPAPSPAGSPVPAAGSHSRFSVRALRSPVSQQQCVPADDEERKVRLRSPAPSPAGSPVPAAGSHSRFSVRALRSPVSQQQCVPADDEERKVRLRSPAPSPAGSPVPAAGSHSRFSVRALRSPVSQQQCVPADDEERKVRLRSPAPSPAGSPVPAAGSHSRFSVRALRSPVSQQQCVPADDEERKVRLRSPAPSPAGSPVPAAGSHSRFSVRALRSPVSQQQCVPADDEERKVRLRSPAPSPAGSPVPAAGSHSRFSVIPVTPDGSTASRFKVVQVADPVRDTPRKTRFSVTRNYDTVYNPTLPPTTPSPSPSPSPSSSPAPEITIDYPTDNHSTDKSSNARANQPLFDYTIETHNTNTAETQIEPNTTQIEPIFDNTKDKNKNNPKNDDVMSIGFDTGNKSIEKCHNEPKEGDLNMNDTKEESVVKNDTVLSKDNENYEQIKTEIKNDNTVMKLDKDAKSKDKNDKDVTIVIRETVKDPEHVDVILDTIIKPKVVQDVKPQYVVSKTVLIPKTDNRTVLTQTEEIMSVTDFVSEIKDEIISKQDVKMRERDGSDGDNVCKVNVDTKECLKAKPESIAKDLKESKSVNMPESVITEPKLEAEFVSNLGPEIICVRDKPETLASKISEDSIPKDIGSSEVTLAERDVDNAEVCESDAKTLTCSLNNEKLDTKVIGDSDNLELGNISDTNKFDTRVDSEAFGDKIEEVSHSETVNYVGDDKVVKTETRLVKSSVEVSETEKVETDVSVTVRSENSLKTKVHCDQNVNKLVKEEKRDVAIKQIEAITEDLSNIIQEMHDLSTKTVKNTATEDVKVDLGVNNVPASRDNVVLKKNKSESSLDSPDLEVSRLMRKPVSAFCDSSSSLEISGSSVESLNTERGKPIIIHEEKHMSKESSVESTSEVTPVNLNVSISSNESVSPIIFGNVKKIHGSLSSLEASMSSVDSARHEKAMVTSADSGIEHSLQNPSETREDSSSNEGTLTCSSSLKESVKKESSDSLTSPKRTSSLLDVPALKSKGLERMRKISWVAPSASFHLPRPEEKVEYKLPTNLEKLLSLFQHPSSLFSRSSEDEKKSTSNTPPRKDSSLTSSFWSWGLTEKTDKEDTDSLSEATDSTLSERVQVSFVDESFSRKLDSKTPSTDTDNTLSEFQTFPNSGENPSRCGESAKVTELTTDDNLVQKTLDLSDDRDLSSPNDLNKNATITPETSDKSHVETEKQGAVCAEPLVKLDDEKVDVRPRSFASVLTSSSENSLEKQSSPETGQSIDKLPGKVIRGIKENISPENTITSSITTKAIVASVWEVAMPCVEKTESKIDDVRAQSDLAPIATIEETSDVAADDLIQLAYIDDAKIEERVVEKRVENVDLGKDALSYLMYENQDNETHSVVEPKSPQGSLAQELRDAEIKEMLDLSPELVVDEAVEIPEIFTVEIKGRKSSPVIPERAKLKKSNSLEDLTKRPVIEEKESPKLKTIAFKVPESTTPRDIPERRGKLRSRSGSSPKSLPESLNKPCPLSKMDSVISKKKKKASSLGKTARDSLLMLNMSEEEIAEFRRPYKLTSVESLRSLESVSEDANSQSGTSVDSRCRACFRTSQESLMSLDSITEDCRCLEDCEKRQVNR